MLPSECHVPRVCRLNPKPSVSGWGLLGVTVIKAEPRDGIILLQQ